MQKIKNALELIKRLGGDPDTGTCRCPVPGHGKGRGDLSPSLWISPEGKGLKCRAGCTYKEVVSALKAKGITVRHEKQHSEERGGDARSSTKRKLLPPVNVDLDEAQRFLDLIGPDAGFWTFQTFDDQGKNRNLAVILHGTLKECAAELKNKSRYGAGVFVCLQRTDGKGRKAENVEAIRAVSVDLDGAPLEPVQEGEPKPHVIVASSPGRHWAHWVVEGLPLDEFKDIVRGIAQRFGGDASIAELAHCTRMPGFEHAKDPRNRVLVQIVEESADPAYTAEQIRTAFPPEAEQDDDADDEPNHQGAKQVDILIGLAADADLFHNEDRGYADINVNGHRETWSIKSKGFRDWLLHRYYKQEGTAPTGEALRLAIETIGARARFDGPSREVFVRVGGHAGKIYLDLCDSEWRVVEIDDGGWRLVGNAPVRFTRAAGMLPLPVPVMGGSVAALRSFVNLAADKGQEDPAADTDFILLVAFLLALLRDRGPYPGLAVMGEEGTAKTTLVEVVRKLVDPSKVRERRLPREDRDLFIAARKAHVISFGNVSHVPDWLSDSLCSLATGGGFGTRTLYTDEDETLFDGMRPVILNGIEFTTRSDLADRLVFLKLPPIRERDRRVEQEFWSEFEQKQPAILGALLGVVAHGLRALPNTPIDVDYPRMADFAHWVTACEGALWESGTFKEAYANNRKRTNLDVIEGETVATAVLRLMEIEEGEWEGTASELLDRLEAIVGEKEVKRKHWPGSASALSARLHRVASRLRKLRIKTSFGREGHARTKVITLKRVKPKPKGA